MADDQLLSQTDIDSLLQSLGAENSEPKGGGDNFLAELQVINIKN